MRNSLSKTFYLLFLPFIIVAFSFEPSTKEINLIDAIKVKLISAKTISNGAYNVESVDISIQNNTASPLRIKIPSGTLFNPADNGEQTLILLEDDFITLKAHDSFEGHVSAYCTEASDRCPTKGTPMKMTMNQDKNLIAMIHYLNGKTINESSFQDAVWAISDGHSISNIESFTKEDKAFRKYLAALTKQEDTWYTSPRSVRIDNNGNFNYETVNISGRIDFECEKGASVRQDIYKASGEAIFVSEKYMTVQSGKVTYKFRLSVKGWEKGDYYIRVHDGTNDIVKYSFKV